jgi:hypothetical protein
MRKKERRSIKKISTNKLVRRRNVGRPRLGWRNKHIFQEVGTDLARPNPWWWYLLNYSEYIDTYFLTELSPSWEAANCAANQEFLSILWNTKVHHRVYKSPPLVPILRQINESITSHPISLRSILILTTHQYPICIPLHPHSCYMPCPSHPPRLHLFNYVLYEYIDSFFMGKYNMKRQNEE